MQVTLQVWGHLREFFPDLAEPTVVKVDPGATVSEVLRRAGIPPELPGSVFSAGRRVSLTYLPHDGETLIVLSPLSGG